MSNARLASIVVDRAIDKPLDYAIPKHLEGELKPGSRVLVPLRKGQAKGTIIEIKPLMHFPGLLSIESHLPQESLWDTDLYKLARWMAKYYMTPLRRTLQVILPSLIRKKGKEKMQIYVKQEFSKQKLAELCQCLRTTFPAQGLILDTILKHPEGILLTELLEITKTSKSPIDSLVKKNALKYTKIQIDRSLLEEDDFFPTKPKILNSSQQKALSLIKEGLNGKKFQTHLIHGVTGSGKTEVYFQAIEHTLSLNKGVILLVPEIALTTQTIERLRSRFNQQIAVLHHRLSIGERFDTWHRIRKGDLSIVIGARSAVFSPMKNLGLIIVDEEHDNSYKQSEESPTYHARDIAIVRAKLSNAVAILGSATPGLESYTNALQGKYVLSILEKRADGAKMPKVHLIDMQKEKEKTHNFSLFSDLLIQEIKNRTEKGEQSLLFLNRRGYHTSQYCRSCRKSIACPHCDISLTFHRSQNILSCHFCGYHLSPPPSICPHCKSDDALKFRGRGTEQVERTLHAILPNIRTLRMDADTTKHKGSHDVLFKQFRSGKADVLIGTQMIAKGLHFPSVTLVGIIQADSALHIPDFRSSEIVFQLLSQVSGRSGRGALPGEVIIQTFLPDHPIITLAAKEDFTAFYNLEIKSRKEFLYPPFVKLIKLCFTGPNEYMTKKYAEEFCRRIKAKHQQQIFPVTPCGYQKIKGKYRFQCIIKCQKNDSLDLKNFPLPPKGIRFLIDVDPSSTF